MRRIFLVIISLIFLSSCITLKKASFDTVEHQCALDVQVKSINVEFYYLAFDRANNSSKEEPFPARYNDEYTRFLENQGCLKVNKNSSVDYKMKFVFEHTREHTFIGQILELVSILTLFITPNIVERTTMLTAALTDPDGKILQQYRFEIETKEHFYLLAAPFIPFQRLKTDMDASKLLLTGFINQARSDNLFK
jgi:hypothetical protein